MTAMITSSSSSSSSSGAPGAQRDSEALSALVRLGFCDAAKVLASHGHERVLAAVAYARSRRNVRRVGAYVRRLLTDSCIPAPLLWPDDAGIDGWNDYRSLDGHVPEEVWTGEPEEGAAAFWVLCLAELEGKVTRPNFETWLSGTVGLALRDGELVVGAASAFARDGLTAKLMPTISRVVSGLWPSPIGIRVVLACGAAERTLDVDETARGGCDGEHRDGEP